MSSQSVHRNHVLATALAIVMVLAGSAWAGQDWSEYLEKGPQKSLYTPPPNSTPVAKAAPAAPAKKVAKAKPAQRTKARQKPKR